MNFWNWFVYQNIRNQNKSLMMELHLLFWLQAADQVPWLGSLLADYLQLYLQAMAALDWSLILPTVTLSRREKNGNSFGGVDDWWMLFLWRMVTRVEYRYLIATSSSHLPPTFSWSDYFHKRNSSWHIPPTTNPTFRLQLDNYKTIDFFKKLIKTTI